MTRLEELKVIIPTIRKEIQDLGNSIYRYNDYSCIKDMKSKCDELKKYLDEQKELKSLA